MSDPHSDYKAFGHTAGSELDWLWLRVRHWVYALAGLAVGLLLGWWLL